MKSIFLHILLPVVMSIMGEFILKYTVHGKALGINLETVTMIIGSPIILVGILLISLSALLWIIGMTKFQLSFMYPFLSLSYVVIIIGSEFLLNEQVSFNRYLSILFIVIGLLLISRSPHVKIKE